MKKHFCLSSKKKIYFFNISIDFYSISFLVRNTHLFDVGPGTDSFCLALNT